MLTRLRVSSFVCKFEFYRPEHYAQGDPILLDFEGRQIR